jgi:hypothetical protein
MYYSFDWEKNRVHLESLIELSGTPGTDLFKTAMNPRTVPGKARRM